MAHAPDLRVVHSAVYVHEPREDHIGEKGNCDLVVEAIGWCRMLRQLL